MADNDTFSVDEATGFPGERALENPNLSRGAGSRVDYSLPTQPLPTDRGAYNVYTNPALAPGASNTLAGGSPGSAAPPGTARYTAPTNNGFFPSNYANQGQAGQALIQSAVDQQQRFTDTANSTADYNYNQTLDNWRRNGSIGPMPERPAPQTFDPNVYAQNYVNLNDSIRAGIGTNARTEVTPDYFQTPNANPNNFRPPTPPPAPATPAQTAQNYISNILGGSNNATGNTQTPATQTPANNAGGNQQNNSLLNFLGMLLGGGGQQGGGMDLGGELGQFLQLIGALGGYNGMLQRPQSQFYYSRPRYSLFG